MPVVQAYRERKKTFAWPNRRCSILAWVLAGLLGPVSGLLADGADIFQRECAACHAMAVDAQPQVGPLLVGILDKPMAQDSSYEYSEALSNKAADRLIWDAATLNHFLLSPRDAIPGTKMGYAGLVDDADREALIAWLADAASVTAASSDASNSISPEVQRILSLTGDPDYGEYLGAECSTCHSGSAASGGVPRINGLPKHYFIQAMLDYKNGVRDNSVMKLMAGNLGDEELAALAAYFAGNN